MDAAQPSRLIVRFIAVMLVSLLLPMAAQAVPDMCRFGSFNQERTVVDIAQLYAAADAVVTGKVMGSDVSGTNLVFNVDKTLKGAVGDEVILHAHQRTPESVLNGFALPGNRELLLFLKADKSGVYENAEAYNSPCNILFFVKEGKVVFIAHDEHNQGLEVAADKVKEFFESNPPALVFNYK